MSAPDERGPAPALSTSMCDDVYLSNGSFVLYSTDASNDRQRPTGVVIPRGAVVGLDTKQALLATTQLALDLPDTGKLSIVGGKGALLPAVHSAEARALVFANGFSWRDNRIRERTDRYPHVVEVFRRAPGDADVRA